MVQGLIYYENTGLPLRSGVAGSGRPVVIVSHRLFGQTALVIPLTTQHKDIPWHIPISALDRPSWAMCEQIRTVNLDELSRLPNGVCSEDELKNIINTIRYIFEGDQYEEKEQE